MAGQLPYDSGGSMATVGHTHFRGVTAMELELDASGYESVLDDNEMHLGHHEPHHHHHTHAHAQTTHHHQRQHHQTHVHQQQQQQPHHSPQVVGVLAPNPPLQEDASAPFRVHGQGLNPNSLTHQPTAVSTTLAGEEQPKSNLISRLVVDPPHLAAWRLKLFEVNETMILTNEEFETYFPHVDNVYSHRSTQKYKRKPFVSHYWDCRMKGRPPGTPKSNDPLKKKRKRNVRERDLCDVKIKITEYASGAQIQLDMEDDSGGSAAAANSIAFVQPGQKIWTIQRVNGNGGNGKGDGVAGPHKHTLDRSDEIKKNSVQRFLAQQEKENKKVQKATRRKATSTALSTVKKHSKDSDLKLYAACWCPFSQRVWIALEAKGIAYQYIETDPFQRPQSTALLEANPKGLVPALKQGEWACAESGVILEFLEDMDSRVPLLPSDPRLKANCRLWIDHINKNIVPSALSLMNPREDPDAQPIADLLKAAMTELVHAADEQGPFFLGSSLSLVDIHLAPLALRLARGGGAAEGDGWKPVPRARWIRWLEALEGDTSIAATVSSAELYAEAADLVVRRTWSRRR